MNGRIVGGALVLIAAVAGGGLYYSQVYAYYGDVIEEAQASIPLSAVGSQDRRNLSVKGLKTIDKVSSPLGYRACFIVPNSLAMMTETYALIDEATPLEAPAWFDCFDAEEIGLALEEGRALAFMGQKEIGDGVDRVIAVLDDGRGFAWHQLNDKYKD